MFLGHMTDQLLESIRAEDGHTLAHLLYPYLPDVAMSLALARRLYSTCCAKRAKLGILIFGNGLNLTQYLFDSNLAPVLGASVITRMLDSVLSDIIKYPLSL